jgi:hypothetical protein
VHYRTQQGHAEDSIWTVMIEKEEGRTNGRKKKTRKKEESKMTRKPTE